MAEEMHEGATQETEQAEVETDWQAKYESMREHMRDWEKKAKANQSAADELERLKAEQMTEQEKLEKRAVDAESELAQLKAESERYEAARKVASETGVPFDLLMYCSDAESMAEFAGKYKSEQPAIHTAARTSGTRIHMGEGDKRNNAQVFADVVADLF